MLQEWNARKVDCFSKPGTNITHNATVPLSDITGGNLSDDVQLPLEPLKGFYKFFTDVLRLPKTCKHNLMYKVLYMI